MRNIKRISLAVLLVVVMLVQTLPAFAAVSPIVYEYGEDGSVISYAYARDLENGAVLYTAIYDAEGNFVSAVKSPVADKAGYLKTTVTPKEGQVVKSFLWDKSSNPFVTEGEYGDSINMDDVTITINNNDLREFIAEDAVIADGASFDIDVYENGLKSTPEVRASSKDSQVESSVKYSNDNATVTITFTKGERLISDKSVTATNKNGVSLFSERYEKPLKATVTVNFVRNYLSDQDLVPGSPCGGIMNVNSCDYHFKKDYTLAEGETVKQINLGFASLPTQSSVVIIEPKDKSADRMTLVKSDGTAPSWDDDTQVIKEFNYNTYTPVAYNKRNTTLITATNQTIWACRELLFGDEGCEISSRYLGDRNPQFGGYNIYGIDGSKTSAMAQALEGCNYIVFYSGDKTNVGASFYVGEDVTVHVFSNSTAVKPADIVDGAFVEWDSSCKGTSKLNKRYQNSVDAISIAWLIREGKITEADILYQKNQNAWYDTNGDGKRQYGDATTNEGLSYLLGSDRVPEGYITGANMSAYYLRRHDAIAYLIAESGSTSGWGFDYLTGKDIPNSILPYYYSETYKYTDYLAMWKDWSYSYDRAPLVTDYVHETAINVENMPMAKGTETATYTGVINVPEGVHFKPISLFADTITPDRTGLEVDANGILKNVNGTGALRQYPDGFGLEDATFFCFTNGPVNDAGYIYGSAGYYDQVPPKGSYHDMWIVKGTCYPWYSFKVSRDAEIYVFATADVKFLEDDPNYDKAHIASDADWIRIYRNMNNNPVNYYSLNRVYSTTAKAGSTIEMKTPGNGEVLYCVFVKEAQNPEINTKLASLCVNGVEVDGFDPEVKEYSVEITDPSSLTAPAVTAVAEDASSTVEVIPAKEFPGSAKVIVSSINGGTDVYTINYTCDATMLTNLEIMDNYVVPKTMFQWAIDSGKLTYTSENDYTISATSNHRPEYFKNGMVVGTKGFNARTYPIGVINDKTIEGKDVIVPSYAWIDSTMNATEAGFISAGQTGGVAVDNWLNFDISRKATIKLFTSGVSAGFKNKLISQGYSVAEDKGYYYVVHNANGGALRNYNMMFTKTFDAGTVSIPNGFTTNDMYTVVIDYADFE